MSFIHLLLVNILKKVSGQRTRDRITFFFVIFGKKKNELSDITWETSRSPKEIERLAFLSVCVCVCVCVE